MSDDEDSWHRIFRTINQEAGEAERQRAERLLRGFFEQERRSQNTKPPPRSWGGFGQGSRGRRSFDFDEAVVDPDEDDTIDPTVCEGQRVGTKQVERPCVETGPPGANHTGPNVSIDLGGSASTIERILQAVDKAQTAYVGRWIFEVSLGIDVRKALADVAVGPSTVSADDFKQSLSRILAAVQYAPGMRATDWRHPTIKAMRHALSLL